jgi:hypothetical protein
VSIGPKHQEIVNIELGDCTTQLGQVLEVDGEKVLSVRLGWFTVSVSHKEIVLYVLFSEVIYYCVLFKYYG